MIRFSLTLMMVISYFISSSQIRTKEITHYIFPKFEDGVVLMKNGRRNEVTINYNSLSEEMIFLKGDIKLAFGKSETELVDTIFIEGRKFVTLKNKYVELLSHSAYDLFVEYRCKVQAPGKEVGYGGTSQTAAVDNYSTIQGNALYELELPDGYETNPYFIYWIKKDGQLHEVLNMSKLKKLYSNKKAQFKVYSKSNNVDFDNPEDIQKLVSFIESN
ncbi:unnamed protein product [Chrysoparadoxa australica]